MVTFYVSFLNPKTKLGKFVNPQNQLNHLVILSGFLDGFVFL